MGFTLNTRHDFPIVYFILLIFFNYIFLFYMLIESIFLIFILDPVSPFDWKYPLVSQPSRKITLHCPPWWQLSVGAHGTKERRSLLNGSSSSSSTCHVSSCRENYSWKCLLSLLKYGLNGHVLGYSTFYYDYWVSHHPLIVCHLVPSYCTKESP